MTPPPIPSIAASPHLMLTADLDHPAALPGQASLTHLHDVAPFDIDLSAGAQMRVERSEATVDEYAAAMKGGAVFPMPVVYCTRIDEEGRPLDALILADGFHRVAAARRAGLPSITVELRTGTRREAILHAVKANTEHGLRPTRLDTRKAIVTLLTDEVWRRWSDREIARRTGASPTTVGKIRKGLGEVAEAPERLYLRDGEERVFEVRAPGAAEEETAELFPSAWPERSPALPPFPDADCDGANDEPDADCDGANDEPDADCDADCDGANDEPDADCDADCDGANDEPDTVASKLDTSAPDDAPDPYAIHRAAAPDEPPRRRHFPAIIDAERDLDPVSRHVLRRWVWTHGDLEGLPSIARLSDLPADLDGRGDDDEAPEWVDLDMHLHKLVKRGLLARRPNGTLKASRALSLDYSEADPRMRAPRSRQSDWAHRRGDEIAEMLGADRIDYIIPTGGLSAAIRLGFGPFGEEHTEILLSGDSPDAPRDLGRTYEQPLARLEELVKAMKGVK